MDRPAGMESEEPEDGSRAGLEPGDVDRATPDRHGEGPEEPDLDSRHAGRRSRSEGRAGGGLASPSPPWWSPAGRGRHRPSSASADVPSSPQAAGSASARARWATACAAPTQAERATASAATAASRASGSARPDGGNRCEGPRPGLERPRAEGPEVGGGRLERLERRVRLVERRPALRQRRQALAPAILLAARHLAHGRGASDRAYSAPAGAPAIERAARPTRASHPQAEALGRRDGPLRLDDGAGIGRRAARRRRHRGPRRPPAPAPSTSSSAASRRVRRASPTRAGGQRTRGRPPGARRRRPSPRRAGARAGHGRRPTGARPSSRGRARAAGRATPRARPARDGRRRRPRRPRRAPLPGRRRRRPAPSVPRPGAAGPWRGSATGPGRGAPAAGCRSTPREPSTSRSPCRSSRRSTAAQSSARLNAASASAIAPSASSRARRPDAPGPRARPRPTGLDEHRLEVAAQDLVVAVGALVVEGHREDARAARAPRGASRLPDRSRSRSQSGPVRRRSTLVPTRNSRSSSGSSATTLRARYSRTNRELGPRPARMRSRSSSGLPRVARWNSWRPGRPALGPPGEPGQLVRAERLAVEVAEEPLDLPGPEAEVVDAELEELAGDPAPREVERREACACRRATASGRRRVVEESLERRSRPACPVRVWRSSIDEEQARLGSRVQLGDRLVDGAPAARQAGEHGRRRRLQAGDERRLGPVDALRPVPGQPACSEAAAQLGEEGGLAGPGRGDDEGEAMLPELGDELVEPLARTASGRAARGPWRGRSPLSWPSTDRPPAPSPSALRTPSACRAAACPRTTHSGPRGTRGPAPNAAAPDPLGPSGGAAGHARPGGDLGRGSRALMRVSRGAT